MFVSIEGKPCLVVGGGAVAVRKCRGLFAFGADVTMIAERFLYQDDLHNIISGDPIPPCGIHKIERSFQEADMELEDWALVVAATDDRSVNRRIAAICHEKQIPVNVADCKEECTFFFPAYCREGQVAVGVTTSGTSPRLAGALRARVEAALPGWLEEIRKETDENA